MNDFKVQQDRELIPLQFEIEIPETHPSETIELSMEFKAPAYPCTTISYWKSVDKDGNILFPDKEVLSCLVNVMAL